MILVIGFSKNKGIEFRIFASNIGSKISGYEEIVDLIISHIICNVESQNERFLSASSVVSSCCFCNCWNFSKSSSIFVLMSIILNIDGVKVLNISTYN